MNASSYNIVFTGEIAQGSDRQQIQNKVIALLKIKDQRIGHLFTGTPAVIKRGLSFQHAMWYKNALAKIGAICEIVPHKNHSTRTPAPHCVNGDGVPETKVSTAMACPKCNYKQEHAEECAKCGIVIRKFQKQKSNERMCRETKTGQAEIPNKSVFALMQTYQNFMKTIIDYRPLPVKVLLSKWMGWRETYHRFIRSCSSFGSKLMENAVKVSMVLSLTTILNLVLMLLAKMMWYVYISTPVGQKFLAISSERAGVIFELLSQNIFGFSVELSVNAFVICLIVCSFCQLFHIAAYLYHHKPMSSRIILWGIPLTIAAAGRIQSLYGLEAWSAVYILTLLTTICVMPICFSVSKAFVPEIGELVQKTIALIKRYCS